jgi:5-methylcytosine-specific restriction enzyme subunit McrC
MRTITLSEHEAKVEILTPEELRDLLTLPRDFLKVLLQREGHYQLLAGSRVGTATTQSVRVMVRPKAGLRNILYVLSYSQRIQWAEQDFPYAGDDLFQAVAWWFDREVGRASRYGLCRAYVGREEALTAIRGRILVGRQVALRPGQPYPIECAYQDYSEDTPLNQVVKSAHSALLRMSQLDVDVSARLRHKRRHLFGDVTSVDYSSSNVPSLSFTRLNRQWENAARIARLILRQQSIRDAEGVNAGAAFTLDMNRLFELFIETVVSEQVSRSYFTLEPQAHRQLTVPVVAGVESRASAINMRPDLILLYGAKAAAVGDIKYKELVRMGDWSHPDIYQLMAYCIRLKLSEGLLIYAGKRPITESRVVGSNLTIRTIGVDLSGKPSEILEQARQAADALIRSCLPRGPV